MKTQETSKRPKVAFIGGGNMATALVVGLLARGWPPELLPIVEKDPGRRLYLTKELKTPVYAEATPAADGAQVIVLAVKPQQLDEAITGFRVTSSGIVLSIVAGTRIATLRRAVGPHCVIVRAMPNTPALAGAGATGLYTENHDDGTARSLATTLLNAVGTTYWVDRENDLDIVTALSGSGPAYFFFLTETLTRVAIDLGLAPDTAAGLAQQTLIGSGRLLEKTSEQPEILRERITSKGGTTAAALASLESGGFHAIVETALHQAVNRAAELGGSTNFTSQ